MNISIWKFPLFLRDEQIIRLPKYSVALYVAEQNDTLCLWALVDPAEETADYTVRIYGTGHRIDGDLPQSHIGTVQQGPAVWHVFWEASG